MSLLPVLVPPEEDLRQLIEFAKLHHLRPSSVLDQLEPQTQITPITSDVLMVHEYRQITGLSTSNTFTELDIRHPKLLVLRTSGRDRVKLWGEIRAKKVPAIRWWLASGTTNWHQDIQLQTMPIEDYELGDPAFDVWMLKPLPDVGTNIVSALVSDTTAYLRAMAVCTYCAQEETIDNFLIACTVSTEQAVPVYGNCFYKGAAYNVEVPTRVERASPTSAPTGPLTSPPPPSPPLHIRTRPLAQTPRPPAAI